MGVGKCHVALAPASTPGYTPVHVAAVLQVLFQVDGDYASRTNKNNEISKGALKKAAIDYVQASIQHTCYMARRTTIAAEVEMSNACRYIITSYT